MKISRRASLGSNFTNSHKKECTGVLEYKICNLSWIKQTLPTK